MPDWLTIISLPGSFMTRLAMTPATWQQTQGSSFIGGRMPNIKAIESGFDNIMSTASSDSVVMFINAPIALAT